MHYQSRALPLQPPVSRWRRARPGAWSYRRRLYCAPPSKTYMSFCMSALLDSKQSADGLSYTYFSTLILVPVWAQVLEKSCFVCILGEE